MVSSQSTRRRRHRAVPTRARAADGSKLSRTAHAYVGPSTLVHTLVTDTTAPADEVAALEGTGTVVKTA